MHARQVGVASRGVAAFGGTTIMTQQRGAQQPQRPQQPQRTQQQQQQQKRPPQQPPRPQQYARPQQQQQQQHQSPFGITVTATQLRHQQQQQQQHRHHVPSYGNMYRKEVENKTEICIMHPDLNSFSSHSVSTIYIHVYICNY